MPSIISKRYILVYFLLSIGFYFAFLSIRNYFINDPKKSPHSIDTHVKESGKFFDARYIVDAKEGGYDKEGYFKSFFLLDSVFPLIYTLLFMSVIRIYAAKSYYKILFIIIITGCLMDYLENFSFAIFLQVKGNGLAPVIAFFSTIKSVVFSINLVLVVLLLFVWTFSRVTKRAKATG